MLTHFNIYKLINDTDESLYAGAKYQFTYKLVPHFGPSHWMNLYWFAFHHCPRHIAPGLGAEKGPKC